jgi:hypothetical protein
VNNNVHCRPNDCPWKGCCAQSHEETQCHGSACGLQMRSASQIASIVSFGVFVLIGLSTFFFSEPEVGLDKTAVQVMVVSSLAVLFYFLTFLEVEDRHSWHLRTLSRPIRLLEISIRLTCLISLSVVFGLNYFVWKSMTIMLWTLVALYALFLAWDYLLRWGTKRSAESESAKRIKEIVARFMKYDWLQFATLIYLSIAATFQSRELPFRYSHWLATTPHPKDALTIILSGQPLAIVFFVLVFAFWLKESHLIKSLNWFSLDGLR